MPKLELFEVADRAVARRGDHAWVFDTGMGWREEPFMVRHASDDGFELEPESFARHFPEAARHALPQDTPQRRRLFRFAH